MKKLMFALMIASPIVLLMGCAAGPGVVSGVWYSNQSGPVIATGEHAPSKVGVSKAESILGLVGQGDASISAAMENGGITKIHHVDFHTKSILGIVATSKIMVYGQ